jgi:dynein light chain 1
MPPIAKLDASLSTLKKCKKLSLSTNTIDKITSVSGMDRCEAAAASSPPPVLLPAPAPRGSRAAVAPPSVLTAGNAPRSLEILSLGRNNIKKIEGLDGVADTLKELWISYNNIEKLAGVEKLKALEILYL